MRLHFVRELLRKAARARHEHVGEVVTSSSEAVEPRSQDCSERNGNDRLNNEEDGQEKAAYVVLVEGEQCGQGHRENNDGRSDDITR